MNDHTVAAIEEAYQSVMVALQERCVTSNVTAAADASLYRLAYLLCMQGLLSQDQLAAVDHFQRAFGLLTGRRIPPSPEVAAGFVDSARQLVGAVSAARRAA